MILRDRNAETSDPNLEERRYFCQNWRHDRPGENDLSFTLCLVGCPECGWNRKEEGTQEEGTEEQRG